MFASKTAAIPENTTTEGRSGKKKLLIIALLVLIEDFCAHAAADAGLTHPPAQVEGVRVAAGRLI